MSTAKALALYQIETFGAGIRYSPSRNDQQDGASRHETGRERLTNHRSAPVRASEFLVQLMVGADADLRKVLGRSDIAERREAAYGAALSNRPSARPLGILRVIDHA